MGLASNNVDGPGVTDADGGHWSLWSTQEVYYGHENEKDIMTLICFQ